MLSLTRLILVCRRSEPALASLCRAPASRSPLPRVRSSWLSERGRRWSIRFTATDQVLERQARGRHLTDQGAQIGTGVVLQGVAWFQRLGIRQAGEQDHRTVGVVRFDPLDDLLTREIRHDPVRNHQIENRFPEPLDDLPGLAQSDDFMSVAD